MFHEGARMLQAIQRLEFADHIATFSVQNGGTYARTDGRMLLPKTPLFLALILLP